jgi:hypothetical protein
VTYNTLPAYDPDSYDKAYMLGEAGPVIFDIGDLVAEWVAGASPNYGLLVTNDFQIYGEWPSVASSDHPQADWRPELVIEYHESGPGVQTSSWGRLKARGG